RRVRRFNAKFKNDDHAMNRQVGPRVLKVWRMPSLPPVLQGQDFSEVEPPKAPACAKIGKSPLPLMSFRLDPISATSIEPTLPTLPTGVQR
ncbi:hypothetical protein RZS08_44045, partial [Arthrospira platensis SPKY1]|nr:hypothetical protein [Arthrospira platensis SPKY1]